MKGLDSLETLLIDDGVVVCRLKEIAMVGCCLLGGETNLNCCVCRLVGDGLSFVSCVCERRHEGGR
jgi:hypothetical protein